jgi:hypothetical protein
VCVVCVCVSLSLGAAPARDGEEGAGRGDGQVHGAGREAQARERRGARETGGRLCLCVCVCVSVEEVFVLCEDHESNAPPPQPNTPPQARAFEADKELALRRLSEEKDEAHRRAHLQELEAHAKQLQVRGHVGVWAFGRVCVAFRHTSLRACVCAWYARLVVPPRHCATPHHRRASRSGSRASWRRPRPGPRSRCRTPCTRSTRRSRPTSASA